MAVMSISQKDSKSVDWTEVKQQLETARRGMEDVWAPTIGKAKRILEERAQALAREPVREESADEWIDVVEFILAHERYAVATEYVREVFPLEEFTSLPCTPDFVLGIVNLRGEIFSVIDIKRFFEIPEPGLTNLNKVIMLEAEGMVFGIVADAIGDVCRILRSDIQPSLPTLTGIRDAYLLGVSTERVVILDAKKLLSDEKIIVHEQV